VATKMREQKMRYGQNCKGGNAGVENAGVDSKGGNAAVNRMEHQPGPYAGGGYGGCNPP